MRAFKLGLLSTRRAEFVTLRSEFEPRELRKCGGSLVKVPWYGTCTVVPQVYLPINSTPLRARETSVDRHAIEQVYYPSIITQGPIF